MAEANPNNQKVQDDFETLMETPAFRTARCVSLPELRIILANRLGRAETRTQGGYTLMQKSHDYATRFSKITEKQVLITLRDELDKRCDIQDFEVALLLNLHPRTIDEAKTIVPSLKRIDDQELDEIIGILDKSRSGYST